MTKQKLSSTIVSCDGGALAGHPLVYLNLEKKGKVVCPYCGHEFKI